MSKHFHFHHQQTSLQGQDERRVGGRLPHTVELPRQRCVYRQLGFGTRAELVSRSSMRKSKARSYSYYLSSSGDGFAQATEIQIEKGAASIIIFYYRRYRVASYMAKLTKVQFMSRTAGTRGARETVNHTSQTSCLSLTLLTPTRHLILIVRTAACL